MLSRTVPLLAAGIILAACQSTSTVMPAAKYGVIPEGFQSIDISGLDKAYAAPGTDLGAYTAIMLAPLDLDKAKIRENRSVRLPYAKDWELTDKDKAQFQKSFRKVMLEALTAENGFSLAENAAENALSVEVTVTEIAPNAPKDDFDSRPSTRSKIYSEGFGDVSISLEVKDSLSGEPLVIAEDKKRGDTTWRLNNSVTNWAEVQRMLRAWSRQIRNGLDSLQAAPRGPSASD